MFLLSPIQNQYQMLFLSESFSLHSFTPSSQHTSKSDHDTKKRLVRLATKLRGNGSDQSAPQSTTPLKEGRRRARVTLDPEMQHELDGLSLTPSNRIEEHLARQEELDGYNWKHVLLGGAFANPVALFDKTRLEPTTLSQIEYSDETDAIGSSTEYERLLRALSKTETDTVPLCLDCTTVFASYPCLLL